MNSENFYAYYMQEQQRNDNSETRRSSSSLVNSIMPSNSVSVGVGDGRVEVVESPATPSTANPGHAAHQSIACTTTPLLQMYIRNQEREQQVQQALSPTLQQKQILQQARGASLPQQSLFQEMYPVQRTESAIASTLRRADSNAQYLQALQSMQRQVIHPMRQRPAQQNQEIESHRLGNGLTACAFEPIHDQILQLKASKDLLTQQQLLDLNLRRALVDQSTLQLRENLQATMRLLELQRKYQGNGLTSNADSDAAKKTAQCMTASRASRQHSTVISAMDMNTRIESLSLSQDHAGNKNVANVLFNKPLHLQSSLMLLSDPAAAFRSLFTNPTGASTSSLVSNRLANQILTGNSILNDLATGLKRKAEEHEDGSKMKSKKRSTKAMFPLPPLKNPCTKNKFWKRERIISQHAKLSSCRALWNKLGCKVSTEMRRELFCLHLSSVGNYIRTEDR